MTPLLGKHVSPANGDEPRWLNSDCEPRTQDVRAVRPVLLVSCTAPQDWIPQQADGFAVVGGGQQVPARANIHGVDFGIVGICGKYSLQWIGQVKRWWARYYSVS